MLCKISNSASLNEIELQLNSKFDYDYLYQPVPVINGLKEASVCMVTSEAPHRIQYGIWGILPKGYKDSWKSFQSIYNTLEIECESITQTSWLFEALKYRRCLIVATGFYTSEIEDHVMHPYLNSLKNQGIFCFAGIYNVLEDGFISCSILTHTNGSSKYHLKNPRPLIISKNKYADFLTNPIPFEVTCVSSFEIDSHEFVQQEVTGRYR
ncbi:SOS response-associated peptidase family protein [Gelidibacter salicanalis]|uniref:Abasic site processing protein n=1 Tax=Gelidibacter salicanalis TaxID=291193 RepID=A0A934KNF1_9FLAO|nr:SOS response-associated peptidase family protein [Gelidibacter salicanalis]MBJ7880494.1 SOS response-associated peptidase family protein [Gelidibacter salicanalis]